MIVEDVALFNPRDIGIKFTNPFYEVEDILENAPVVKKGLNGEEDTVVGFVDRAVWDGYCYTGDIFIWPLYEEMYNFKMEDKEILFDLNTSTSEYTIKEIILYVSPFNQ